MEYADAPPEARAVFDDIKRTRGIDDVNNFWKALAVHPPTLARTWASLREVMAPGGALDPLAEEMLHLAASAARARGMTEAVRSDLLAVAGMAAETNRLAEALRVPLDLAFEEG